MGPLVVNELISENTNLFLAFLIGIGFGYVLENNGFSSSRRLAGMFYGYDTTVLKVFFTAAVTAAVGLLFLGLFGWLDLSLIYINPTYLWSTLGEGLSWALVLSLAVIARELLSVLYPSGKLTRWHFSAE